MISCNKTLVYAIVSCLLSINCNAAVFQQITLQGEYLTPNGHPGVPYTGTPTDWTVWQEEEESPYEIPEIGFIGITKTFNLLLDNGQDEILLDSYSMNVPDFVLDPPIPEPIPFSNIIVDGQRVSWESNSSISSPDSYLNVYSDGTKETFSFGTNSSYEYDYAFGSNYFAIFEREYYVYSFSDLVILSTDTMEWHWESINLNQVFPESNSQWGFGSYSMQVYENGIELLQPRQYIGLGDNTWYTEHFWMEVPEPITFSLIGFGAIGLLFQKKRRNK